MYTLFGFDPIKTTANIQINKGKPLGLPVSASIKMMVDFEQSSAQLALSWQLCRIGRFELLN
ncbi:hypothetical protein AYI96_18925 [Shewanella sp. MSW]|nr:hypothetical protein AYI96_18925 [Shewanella sp. MSW]